MVSFLLVDDEEDICDFLSGAIEMMGFDSKYALSGEAALNLVEQNKFDVAIVDFKLPTAITGLDVIRAIRGQHPHTLVIAMSGYVDVGLAQEIKRIGVSDYLEKPRDIHPNVFSGKIKKLLSQHGLV